MSDTQAETKRDTSDRWFRASDKTWWRPATDTEGPEQELASPPDGWVERASLDLEIARLASLVEELVKSAERATQLVAATALLSAKKLAAAKRVVAVAAKVAKVVKKIEAVKKPKPVKPKVVIVKRRPKSKPRGRGCRR